MNGAGRPPNSLGLTRFDPSKGNTQQSSLNQLQHQPSGPSAGSQNPNLSLNLNPVPKSQSLMIPANQSVFNTVKQLVEAGQ